MIWAPERDFFCCCFFKAGVISASFPSGVEISFHWGREVVGRTLCDASQGRINMGWNLFILGFETSHLSQSFSSSQFFGFWGQPFQSLCGALSLSQVKVAFMESEHIGIMWGFLRIKFFLTTWSLNKQSLCSRLPSDGKRSRAVSSRRYEGPSNHNPASLPLPSESFVQQTQEPNKCGLSSVEEDFTFSWYKSEQLQGRVFFLS